MKMVKKNVWALILSLIAWASTNAYAQDVKIGVVDAAYIMANIAEAQLPQYQTAQSNVETYGKKLEEEYLRQVQAFQEKAQGYEAGAATMTEEGIMKAREDLAKMEQEIRKFEQDAQIMLQQKEAAELEPIYAEIQNIINVIAQEQGFTYILRKEVLLYEPAGADISDEVLRRMGITPKN